MGTTKTALAPDAPSAHIAYLESTPLPMPSCANTEKPPLCERWNTNLTRQIVFSPELVQDLPKAVQQIQDCPLRCLDLRLSALNDSSMH